MARSAKGGRPPARSPFLQDKPINPGPALPNARDAAESMLDVSGRFSFYVIGLAANLVNAPGRGLQRGLGMLALLALFGAVGAGLVADGLIRSHDADADAGNNTEDDTDAPDTGGTPDPLLTDALFDDAQAAPVDPAAPDSAGPDDGMAVSDDAADAAAQSVSHRGGGADDSCRAKGRATRLMAAPATTR